MADLDKNKEVEEPTMAYGSGKVITDISMLDMNKLYNYAQYCAWQFNDRVELIKGRLFKMSPAPSRYHQDISLSLGNNFVNYFKGKPCKVYVAPFDVRFPNNKKDKNPFTVVQPDICVICDKAKLDDRGCNGAPDLIVEILSPSTSAKDTSIKFDLYEEYGVKEYWIVDPSNKILDQFVLSENGKYQLIRKYNYTNTISVNLFPELIIELAQVFEDDVIS